MRLPILFAVLLHLGHSAPAPVVCVPTGPASGPPNAQGIIPIQCQMTNGTTITCYPSTQQTFPQQVNQRIYCTPMEPVTSTVAPTTTMQPTTVVTPTSTEAPASSTTEVATEGASTEALATTVGPSSSSAPDLSTTAEPLISSSPETTEASTELSVTGVVPVICVPIAPIENGTLNADGVAPIQCMTVGDNETLIECYPQTKDFDFSQNPPVRIYCVPIVGGVSTPEGPEVTVKASTPGFPGEVTVEVSTVPEKETSLPPVTCVPIGSEENGTPNSEGVKPIECMLEDNVTIIVCYPENNKDIDFSLHERILCVPIEGFTVIPVSLSTDVPSVECIPIGPSEDDEEDENGVKAIQCKLEFNGTIIECFPESNDFTFSPSTKEFTEVTEAFTEGSGAESTPIPGSTVSEFTASEVSSSTASSGYTPNDSTDHTSFSTGSSSIAAESSSPEAATAATSSELPSEAPTEASSSSEGTSSNPATFSTSIDPDGTTRSSASSDSAPQDSEGSGTVLPAGTITCRLKKVSTNSLSSTATP